MTLFWPLALPSLLDLLVPVFAIADASFFVVASVTTPCAPFTAMVAGSGWEAEVGEGMT